MRVTFERSGGFGNVPLKTEIDSDEMPPERAEELERLVAKAKAFDQPSEPTASQVPDDLHYHMTIKEGARSKTIKMSDTAAPDHLKMLFDFLGEEALNKVRENS